MTGETPIAEDSITVAIVGTLRTGIFAIGGETTGSTITADEITWELEFGESAAFRRAAEKLHGKKVIVQGSLERRQGVEIKERWIVTATGLQAMGDAGLGGNPERRLFRSRIAGGNGKIPLQDGYFEVPLPVKLFEGNAEEITLRWIDFYRN